MAVVGSGADVTVSWAAVQENAAGEPIAPPPHEAQAAFFTRLTLSAAEAEELWCSDPDLALDHAAPPVHAHVEVDEGATEAIVPAGFVDGFDAAVFTLVDSGGCTPCSLLLLVDASSDATTAVYR